MLKTTDLSDRISLKRLFIAHETICWKIDKSVDSLFLVARRCPHAFWRQRHRLAVTSNHRQRQQINNRQRTVSKCLPTSILAGNFWASNIDKWENDEFSTSTFFRFNQNFIEKWAFYGRWVTFFKDILWKFFFPEDRPLLPPEDNQETLTGTFIFRIWCNENKSLKRSTIIYLKFKIIQLVNPALLFS